MIFDFNGMDIDVPLADGFVPTDCIVIIRGQSISEPGVDTLSMGVTEHTGGILQHGMLALVATADYADAEYDDE
jgi:hypothetical protein